MKRRLLPAPAGEGEADIRPTLLGIVTLLFLLLFFLLSTSTGQRLGVHTLKVSSPDDLAQLPHTGLVQDVRVRLVGGAATVLFSVTTTDIAAAATAVEKRVIEIPPKSAGHIDLVLLDAAMAQVHAIDPSQERLVLDPDEATPMDQVFRAMDIIKGPLPSPYFPKLTLADG